MGEWETAIHPPPLSQLHWWFPCCFFLFLVTAATREPHLHLTCAGHSGQLAFSRQGNLAGSGRAGTNEQMNEMINGIIICLLFHLPICRANILVHVQRNMRNGAGAE